MVRLPSTSDFQTEVPSPAQTRSFFVLVGTLAVVLLLTIFRGRGPQPRGLDAPSDSFSAARAHAELVAVLGGDGVPHPIGSAEHDRVRDRIVARLRAFGYAPRVSRDFACDPYGSCATVENIVATLEGTSSRQPVMLVAHYDSAAAGPGASDDGAGVATILEIARIVRRSPVPGPIVFLIDDGEELGLLGAEAFMAHDPLAGKIGAVLNFEARGNQGLVFMFETGRDNRWLIEALAKSPRPAAGSIFHAIYERMPNDTDLTVFKRGGLRGLNFANLGNVASYHTAQDTAGNLSLMSLQHRGENALATLRALLALDVSAVRQSEKYRQNAVYFDVLQFHLFWWPMPWTFPVAVVNLLVMAAILFVRRAERGTGRGALLFFCSLITAAVAAFLMTRITVTHTPAAWLAHPLPAILTAWLLAFSLPCLLSIWLLRRASFEGALVGVSAAWAVLAAAVAGLLPGGSYLFLVPSLVLTIVSLRSWSSRL